MALVARLLPALVAVLLGAPVFAQYPARPVHLVVPFPAGAIADGVSRTIAQALSRNLGQPVIVDNKGGADGAIGTLAVIKSAPDGYSLLVGAPAAIFGPQALRKNPPFDILTDLTPVA